MESRIYSWGSILHKKWEEGSASNFIKGFWAEDLNEYYIMVPPQLRGVILHLQNYLSDLYCELDNLRSRVRKIERLFE